MWDEITYPFSSFNVAAIEIWERISKFIHAGIKVNPC